MPHFLFMCPQGKETPGCIERFMVYVPWNKPAPAMNGHGQPLSNPQTGQPVMMTPAQMAWQWGYEQLKNSYPFPPGVPYNCQQLTNGAPEPSAYCVQTTPPAESRVPVNAPWGTPVASHQNLTMPPSATPQGGPRGAPQGMYEEIHDCGLVTNADPMMGEIDGAGGTFTDIDRLTGQEVVRQTYMPASPKHIGQ